MLSLTACSAPLQQPPAELLADCPAALPPTDRSNGALAEYIPRSQKALKDCNADKAALRVFYGR